MAHHVPVAQLLSANSQWAAELKAIQPEFFADSAKGQAPKILWIGCADSRVPESVVTGAKPGDIFVLRNIANQFHPEDDSAVAVLTYAVNFIGVEHIVVCGHTECGGAIASLAAASDPNYGKGPVIIDSSLPPEAPLNKYLTPMTNLAATLELTDKPKLEATNTLIEENVKRQVAHICETSIVQNAWKSKGPKGNDVFVHGWVYDISKGKIHDLGVSQGPGPSP